MRRRARGASVNPRSGRRSETRAWADAQRRAHELHWPDIDHLLSDVPSRLFRQIKLLEYDLAIRYSESGQFHDVFLGASQVPLLSIAAWLFDDVRLPHSIERDRAEGQLFRAALLLAGRTHTIEGLRDRHSFYDTDHVALVQHFSERATLELARTIPAQAPFWTQWASISADELEWGLELVGQEVAPDLAADPDAHLRGRWSAAAQVTAYAASAFAGHDEIAAPLANMLDSLTAAVQIRDDLATLTRDLDGARPTYPIVVIAQAAGIPLRPWPDATEMLGAMIATGSDRTLRDAALARLRLSSEGSRELGLPTFKAYLEDATVRLEGRFSGPSAEARSARAASDRPARTVAPIRGSAPTLEQALAMAEGFLLADPLFSESWESHREGMFGSDLVVSRYPAGMVMEILAGHGHDMAEQIDDFQAFTVGNGFRYFDHPWSGIDSDTVGVYLRLASYATNGDLALAPAAHVIDCLQRNVRERGWVPVWISGCEEAPDDRPPVLDLGEGCGTVAAHLLLGLLAVESADYREVLNIGALDLLNRIRERGLGANVNYPPLYALATFLRLIGRLATRSVSPEVAKGVDATRAALLDELERATRARVIPAQHAALLISACHSARLPSLIDPAWVSAILKKQRFDGSWSGEPFFAAPNRGRWVTWYASTILTSALCYDALMRSSLRGDVERLQA